MAVFMAGVGTAEIFKVGKDGQENLFSTAKTLTESGITIGVSAEDVRAGAGAKLYGKYFHTSTFDLKMTDAMFKLEYIAANVGSEIDIGGDVFINEKLISNNGKIYLTHTPVPMSCGKTIYAYAKKTNEDFYNTYQVKTEEEKNTDGEKTGNVLFYIVVDKESSDNLEYCVKYLYTNENAKTLTVSANFIPDTLRVYLTMNLFSGDDKNPQTGTRIGSLTVMIPRFLLNGTQDLSMSMTGASNTSFEGSALASEDCGTGSCDGDGIYAKIIEVIDGYDWRDDVIDIVFDTEYVYMKDPLLVEQVNVFAKFRNYKPRKLICGVDYKLTSSDNVTISNGNTVTVNLTEVPTAIVKANGIGLLDGLQAKKIYSKSQKLEYGMLDYTKFQDFILSE